MTQAERRRGATPPLVDGRVVASHGRQVEVLGADGRRVPCRLHGRRLAVVCGDRVRWSPDAGDAPGLVYEILPRQTVLERLAGSGHAEPVVANLTQLAVVAAPRPAPDWFVVDRYLAGAAWSSVGSRRIGRRCVTRRD